MAPGTKGEGPAVGFSPVIGNEADGAGRGQVCNQGVAWRDEGGVYPAEADASANEGALFHASVLCGSVLLRDFDGGGDGRRHLCKF